jgi:hypothetical protein
VDDSNVVILVFAISDIDKAKSNQLRRAEKIDERMSREHFKMFYYKLVE